MIARKLILLAAAALAVALASSALAEVVISEVDYDQPSTDTAEWVELYNSAASPVTLSGIDMVFLSAAGCSEYNRINLDGITIAGGGFVVIGNHACAVTNGGLPASNAIQNGAPDTIVLEDRGSATVLSGVEYENTGAATCGGTATTAADGTVADTSIQLCSGIWELAPSTPCAPPACGAVAIDAASWGSVKGRF